MNFRVAMEPRLKWKKHLVCQLLALPLPLIVIAASAAVPDYKPDPRKVLRYAFEIAETTFDPHKVADTYSNIVNNAMFDTPLVYDYLASPAKLRANTLVALPEVSVDYKTFTLRVKPGIYFADDPAFDGKKRELVAEDYVYSIKRLFDPTLTAPARVRFASRNGGARRKWCLSRIPIFAKNISMPNPTPMMLKARRSLRD